MDIVIDSIRYHIEKNGEGFPLLCLHGFTGDSSTWFPFYQKWGSHSQLIAIDIIGHGQSESPEAIDKYRMETFVQILYTLLEKMNIDQVDILGYSMGGRLAIAFAVKFPEKIRRLVLESTSPGLALESERVARRQQDANLADTIRKKGIESFVDYWENIPLFESQNRLPDHVQTRIREQRLNNNVIGLSNSLLGMGTGSQPSYWENLKKLTFPVLIVTGALDRKFCQIAEKMLKSLKNGQWMTIENGGHALHVEEPEKFGTIVSGFLSQENG